MSSGSKLDLASEIERSTSDEMMDRSLLVQALLPAVAHL